MRLDHLLSKEKVEDCFTVELSIKQLKEKEEAHYDCLRQWALQGNKVPPINGSLLITVSGGDAVRGNTRTHPEHDG